MNRKLAGYKKFFEWHHQYSWLSIDGVSDTFIKIEALSEQVTKTRKAIRAKLKVLCAVGIPSEQKPAISYSEERSWSHWFDKNDEVVFYLNDGHFKRALVSQSPDDIPYVRIKDGTSRTEDEYGFYMESPLIMHAWEFSYMNKHPRFIDIWIEAGRKSEPPTGFPEIRNKRKTVEQAFRKAILSYKIEAIG